MMTPDEREALIYKTAIAATIKGNDFLSNDTHTVKNLIDAIAKTSFLPYDDIVFAVYFYATINGKLPKNWQEIQQDRILNSFGSRKQR